MKKFLAYLLAAFALTSVALAPIALTGCAGGQLTPTAGADISNALLTVANVLQQTNTGLQTAAPSINSVLTATHNQGDAGAVNNVVAITTEATPALEALLAVMNAAIKANTQPAAQIAAVNAALSPETVSTIVAAVVPAPSS